MTNGELRYLIDEYVNGRNAQRDREMLKRRLIDGIRIEPLAEEFDLSVRQVNRILQKRYKAIFP